MSIAQWINGQHERLILHQCYDSLQNLSHYPRLSQAQYSLAVQNHGLKQLISFWNYFSKVTFLSFIVPLVTSAMLRQASLPTMDALSTTPTGAVGGAKQGGAFIMPREPPTKEQWVPDSEADVCMVCKMEHFGMVRYVILLLHDSLNIFELWNL